MADATLGKVSVAHEGSKLTIKSNGSGTKVQLVPKLGQEHDVLLLTVHDSSGKVETPIDAIKISTVDYFGSDANDDVTINTPFAKISANVAKGNDTVTLTGHAVELFFADGKKVVKNFAYGVNRVSGSASNSSFNFGPVDGVKLIDFTITGDNNTITAEHDPNRLEGKVTGNKNVIKTPAGREFLNLELIGKNNSSTITDDAHRRYGEGQRILTVIGDSNSVAIDVYAGHSYNAQPMSHSPFDYHLSSAVSSQANANKFKFTVFTEEYASDVDFSPRLSRKNIIADIDKKLSNGKLRLIWGVKDEAILDKAEIELLRPEFQIK